MKEQNTNTILQAFQLLKKEYHYSQVQVVNKLNTLDVEITPATFNKIIKGNYTNLKTITEVEKGIFEIVKQELDWVYEESSFKYFKTKDWKPSIVPEIKPKSKAEEIQLKYHQTGRISIPYHVDFINGTKKELIYLGVRMRNFKDYFTSSNEKEFKIPIRELLEKGVNIKIYLLAPESNVASFYFDDRSNVFEDEKDSPEIIKKTIKSLLRIQQEFKDCIGKFEIYTYKHIPHYHLILVDSNSKESKLLISNYLYGISRANCPLLEIYKQNDRSLFRKYVTSFNKMTEKAKLVQS